MLVAYNDHIEEAKLLINAGADVNARDDDGATALMWSSEEGHTETAKLLIDAGADINAKTSKDILLPAESTALMWSSKEGHIEAVKLLINAGADVNAKAVGGNTALY